MNKYNNYTIRTFLTRKLSGIFVNSMLAIVIVFGVSNTGLYAQTQAPHPRTIIVMDGSGSMWGQIGGVPKLQIARETVADVLQNVPANLELGLIAYGHREKGNCNDIELIIPPAPNMSVPVLNAVNSMRFLGKTPLSQAVRQAAEALRFTEDKANVVLITDGLETCSADPCALGYELEAAGLDFTVHVVGFGLSEEEGRQVSCLAENTGGKYLQASDGEGLTQALNQTILVTQDEMEPTGSVRFHINITYSEGTSRPTDVILSAKNLNDGTILELGHLMGAEQIINGLMVDLTPSDWRIEAVGPVGSGSVDVAINRQTRQVNILFTTVLEKFSFENLGPYQLGQSQMFLVRNNAPLQDNATYTINLFPAGATSYDQRLEFTYKFGNEIDGYSEHSLEAPQAAGAYEIIILQGGYNLDEAIARFPISYAEEAIPGWEAPDVVQPGEVFPFKVLGQLYRNNTLFLDKDGVTYIDVWLNRLVDETGFHLQAPDEIGTYDVSLRYADLNGETRIEKIGILNVGIEAVKDTSVSAAGLTAITVRVPKIYSGLLVQWSAVPVAVNSPADAWAPHDITDQPLMGELEPGIWDFTGDAGDNVFIGRMEVIAGGENNFIIPYSTTASPAGEDDPVIDGDFEGYICDTNVACQIEHIETGIAFTLPPGWRAETPYFYQTAGGALYGEPTITFYGPETGDEPIVLNPVRWMIADSICTQTRIGAICRYDPAPESVLQVYEMLAQNITFNGIGGHNSLIGDDINDLLVHASQ